MPKPLRLHETQNGEVQETKSEMNSLLPWPAHKQISRRWTSSFFKRTLARPTS
jgi:hypothetical protein